MKRGIATFELDWGHCPPWLFEKMVSLSSNIIEVIVSEFGAEEFVKRISDPVWFQSFGNLLAFDWNSSGLTTTLTAALKEALRGKEKEYGIFICGGKGKTSRKTPTEILEWAWKIGLDEKEAENLVYTSKMSAKVDNALIQDGYQIYHHCFIFSIENPKSNPKIKSWAVIQQGMNLENATARRYHWFSEKIKNLIVEPHLGIVYQKKENKPVLNLSAEQSEENRKVSVEVVKMPFKSLLNDLRILEKHSHRLAKTIKAKTPEGELTLLSLKRGEFFQHEVEKENFLTNKYLLKILHKLSLEKPENYEKLLAVEGVGPKTIRALALISEIIYKAPASLKDPARYSFAHGGKDGTPFPVDKEVYNQSIAFTEKIIKKAKIPLFEKNRILDKLKNKEMGQRWS